MRRGIRWAGLLVLLALVMPATGADEKKTPKPDDTKKVDKKDEFIAVGRPFPATILSVDGTTIKLHAKIPVYRGARIVSVNEQDMELETAESVKVRIEALPPKVGEDGKKIKYTADELKELKGKETWGYTGTMDNVQPERIVRIFLGKKRGADKEDPPQIIQIQVAKMPGDDKIDPLATPSGTPKKPKDGDAPEAGEVPMVAFGRPFVAMYVRTENDTTIHLLQRVPFFNNGKVEYRDNNGSFEAAENMKIRVELPPPELDDNGKIKKYTKEELKELKGDEKEWGYAGSWENLEPGRGVRVHLGKPKGAERTDPALITALHVLKEPGDTKIDPAELVFVEKKKKVVDDKKDEEKKPEEKKPDDKKAEDKPPPFGRPFIGQVTRAEGLRVSFKVKERFLNGAKVEYRDKDVEYNLYEGAKIRSEIPPLAFDDKGSIKKYTAEELKQMKGPEELWGYPADTESIQPGRTVKVFLGKYLEDKKDPPLILMLYMTKPPKVTE